MVEGEIQFCSELFEASNVMILRLFFLKAHKYTFPYKTVVGILIHKVVKIVFFNLNLLFGRKRFIIYESLEPPPKKDTFVNLC